MEFVCAYFRKWLTRCRFRIPASTPNPPRHPTPPLNGNETPKAPDHLVEPLPDLELSLPLSPPPIEDIIAARRAKRAAIIAKYQVTGSETPSQVAPEPTAFAPAKSESNGTAPATPAPGPTFLVPQQVEELSDGERCGMAEVWAIGLISHLF